MFYLTSVSKPRVIHTLCLPLYKCCWCIHLRVGAGITCVIWISLSLYFAVTSFQGQSPFFSYLDTAAIMVFGVMNLILFIAALAGLLAVYLRTSAIRFVFAMAHLLVVATTLVLISGFANTILFITRRQDYLNWCVDSAATKYQIVINGSANSNNSLTSGDFYNCTRTWADEVKFSVLAYMMIFVFYIYWVLCFWSFSVKTMVSPALQGPPTPGGHPPSTGMPVHAGPPPPMAGAAYPSSNIVVLNNLRPSRSKNRDDSQQDIPSSRSNSFYEYLYRLGSKDSVDHMA